MPLINTDARYGVVTMALHWLTAALVLALFGLGLFMTRLDPQTDAEIDSTFFYFSLHKTLGLTVLVLAVLRVLMWLIQPRPRPLATHTNAEVFAAHTVHWLLYALIFLMPLTGWLHHSATSGLAPIWPPFPQRLGFVPQTITAEAFFGWAHFACAWAMCGVVALHVAGALKHLVIDRDGTLHRMLPGAAPQTPLADRHGPARWPGAAAIAALVVLLGAIAVLRPAVPPGEAMVRPDSTISANWIVDHAASRLEIEAIQNKSPVRGRFSVWSAQIAYDPAAPAEARIEVSVDIASLDLGGITPQALSKDFLNAAAHPVAHYRATGWAATGDGRFTTEGTLTLAGAQAPLPLAFDLKINGDTAQATGMATTTRRTFGIGPEGDLIGPGVTIHFDISARRN